MNKTDRHHSWAEPYKIKMVELVHMTTRAEREIAIKKQHLIHSFSEAEKSISIFLPIAALRP